MSKLRSKRRNVCQNCRAKKLACDGVQPECSQCLFKQICCSGYKQEFVFVPNINSDTDLYLHPAHGIKSEPLHCPFVPGTQHDFEQPNCSSLPPNTTSPIRHLQDRFGTTAQSGLEDDIEFIVEQYAPNASEAHGKPNLPQNQICGAWVSILPLMNKIGYHDQYLVSAIRTLATALRHCHVKAEVLQPRILDLYCDSLSLMGEALAAAQGVLQIEHCVAIMCLADADIISAELKSGWMTHAKAVGEMMESLGPMCFSNGTMHTVFIGFRPLLLLSSVLNRRATFLAQDKWTIETFDGRPSDAMQLLISVACKLPALLERFDETIHLPYSLNFQAMCQLWHDFAALLMRLRGWERERKLQASRPLFWLRSGPEIWLTSSAGALWYPDLKTANTLMHCWAFEIIVRTHLSKLRSMIHTHTLKDHDRHSVPQIEPGMDQERSLLTLADMICDSISYLLQPEFKFHGLWSAFFTLPTALRVFNEEPNLGSTRIRRSRQLETLLATRQVQFALD